MTLSETSKTLTDGKDSKELKKDLKRILELRIKIEDKKAQLEQSPLFTELEKLKNELESLEKPITDKFEGGIHDFVGGSFTIKVTKGGETVSFSKDIKGKFTDIEKLLRVNNLVHKANDKKKLDKIKLGEF